ncbi:MAG: PepSY-associated TM helix domain-containing protein, partial [Gemmatimonadaceae bacterium]
MLEALTLFHRWLALIVSVVVLVLALTGSALVFEGAMDRALNPRLWHVTPSGAPRSLDTLLARARGAVSSPVTGLTLPREDDRALVAQAGARQVFVDPFTGAVLGTRQLADYNSSLPRRLHVLHVSLVGGSIGGTIVGVVTVSCLLLVLTGIVLWWPDRIARVRWGASWKRVVFDLHHLLGIVAAVILVVITASGTMIHYESLGRVLQGERVKSPVVTGGGGLGVVSVDSALSLARAALPGARPTLVSFPAKDDQPLAVGMRYPEDRTPGGRSRVYVDAHRGVVLRADGTRGLPAG